MGRISDDRPCRSCRPTSRCQNILGELFDEGPRHIVDAAVLIAATQRRDHAMLAHLGLAPSWTSCACITCRDAAAVVLSLLEDIKKTAEKMTGWQRPFLGLNSRRQPNTGKPRPFAQPLTRLVFRLIHLHPTARLARVFFARWRLRMMDLAVAVHMKGFGCAFR
jgi:hypothetical protein